MQMFSFVQNAGIQRNAIAEVSCRSNLQIRNPNVIYVLKKFLIGIVIIAETRGRM